MRQQFEGRLLPAAQFGCGVVHKDPPQRRGRLVLSVLLQAQHRGAADDLRPGALRQHQQVEVQRIFGVVVAAGEAVAATDAAIQLHLRCVGISFLRHADVDRPPRFWRQSLQHVGLGVCLRPGLPAAQPLAQSQSAGDEARVVAQLFRPARALHHRGMRRLQHAGIDQRTTAHAAGDQHAGVGAGAQVEQPVAHAARVFGLRRGKAHVPGQVRQARGEAAAQVFLAALQHAHTQAPALGVAQAAELFCRHCGAIAAADDDHIEGDLWPRFSTCVGVEAGAGIHQGRKTL